ncbi:MAG: alpha/beta family hydrolase [Alphaproteobacteria bacterium]
MIPILFDGPEDAALTLILAHGAGAPMDSDFMNVFAAGIAKRGGQHGIRTARFEFPYMAIRRATGKKRPPDRPPILLQAWREVMEQVGHVPLAIGGKSMGGRMATLLAAEDDAPEIAALVCLAYPFHPPGKPDRLRTAHLADLATPTLIVQGDRDALGNRDEVAGYTLSKSVRLHWCPDGDHDLTPRKRSGFTQEGNWEGAMDAVAGFLAGL